MGSPGPQTEVFAKRGHMHHPVGIFRHAANANALGSTAEAAYHLRQVQHRGKPVLRSPSDELSGIFCALVPARMLQDLL